MGCESCGAEGIAKEVAACVLWNKTMEWFRSRVVCKGRLLGNLGD